MSRHRMRARRLKRERKEAAIRRQLEVRLAAARMFLLLRQVPE